MLAVGEEVTDSLHPAGEAFDPQIRGGTQHRKESIPGAVEIAAHKVCRRQVSMSLRLDLHPPLARRHRRIQPDRGLRTRNRLTGLAELQICGGMTAGLARAVEAELPTDPVMKFVGAARAFTRSLRACDRTFGFLRAAQMRPR